MLAELYQQYNPFTSAGNFIQEMEITFFVLFC